jgi:type II secretory ATPase GspE/PulE/Tfp pilus assembly ATPase PilB-like protein
MANTTASTKRNALDLLRGAGAVDLIAAAAEPETQTQPFCWPAPPFSIYPMAQPHTGALPCAIVGLNDKLMQGQVSAFLPDQLATSVRLPPSRSELLLRFDQFRSLTLRDHLLPHPLRNEPGTQALNPGKPTSFRLVWKQGGEWSGSTIGCIETPYGLFLFQPADDSGAVLRTFVPRSAFVSFDIGQRIGEVLIEQHAATARQVERAAEQQRQMREQRLGDILVSLNIVTQQQLVAALAQQSLMPMVRVGEALMSLGLIDIDDLQTALRQQEMDRDVPLGEILVRSGVVTQPDLQTAMARKMGYPLVDVDVFPIEAEALRKLPYSVAMRLRVLPLLIHEGRLVIALDAPARRREAIDEVEFASQMKVLPVLGQSRSMAERTHAAYDQIGAASGGRANQVDRDQDDLLPMLGTEQLVETLERENEETSHEDQPIEQSDNSLVRLINNMIVEASREGVSDIHIESYPGREKIRIRFRKDGSLRTYLELPPTYRSALVARIKIMCDLDISERRKPQDGKINFAKFMPQHRVELRVATIPTHSNLEDVVMRILASAKPMPLDLIGLTDYNFRQLTHAIQRPYGLVLCVGPTGSGKTTTLHSALSYINVPERKIWTAEDPIEITQAGLRQVQVNPKIDWTFAKALRAFLRADPDVIMVGEIRDQETSHMAVEASLTGHLVLSTLHTNSAPETVTRLLDMGMDPFNFADALLVVLAQRLVRRLCTSCRTSRAATEEEIEELLADYLHTSPKDNPLFTREALRADWTERFGESGRLRYHSSSGCAACNHSGQRGRAGLHELLTVSREIRRMIQSGARAEELQRVAMIEGMRTLRQDGIEKVLQGITSLEEVRANSNL